MYRVMRETRGGLGVSRGCLGGLRGRLGASGDIGGRKNIWEIQGLNRMKLMKNVLYFVLKCRFQMYLPLFGICFAVGIFSV